VVDLDRDVTDEKVRLVAAVLALPALGGVGLRREHDVGLFAAVGAKIGVTGTRRVDDAFFTL
jgi:hypothetical protein